MKVRILTVALISVGCVLLIIFLFLLSYEVNRAPNNFIRLFPPHVVLPDTEIKIQYNAGYIAGADKKNIYLGENLAFNFILSVDKANSKTQLIKIDIQPAAKMRTGEAKVFIDSPYFFLTGAMLKSAYRGSISEWIARPYFKNKVVTDVAIPIKDSSFIFRIIDRTKGYSLAKSNNGSTAMQKAPDLLEKQVDDFFSKDGMLHYNKKAGQLVYLYYYRNQFTVADTNLKLVYKGKTIDTVSQAKIKIGSPDKNGEIKLAEPPVVVNKKSCVSDEYLFVQSNLKADNEDIEQFKNAWVVDVYEIENGKYKLSFYLPKTKTGKIKDMKVTGKTMAVLYEHKLCTYKLNF
ncbi:hypothetical protein [Pedobacter heparinus]|uniref:hypothetical protein n=1 Tax=Pedobacter heparinus TaxID=984 RepID=UPI00292EDD0E|nr:hypothetical protein [Pedobacter heparinus]